ncbi:methyltransferase domain-containing protein [Cerasibacillus terrae]|uniref:Methyltransferase domain-containing protein n=1 Tax=Cerasibacillus terrae TaxID=2498845 RepID=A0A5C8NIE4_9BACI|nr:class I SAM-dependent methyltransferase [Cerasibacillus terrae]TXL58174.1 methyltransferase domain-containing protein [Cerasibacillus terrae]
MVMKILDFSHQLLKDCIKEGETVVDATCGNGNDTLFLSKLVGKTGQVYAFDIQEQAITQTKQLLEENKQVNVTLILDSHANMEKYLPETIKGKLGGAIFNLGYLPHSDKTIITKGNTTIRAIDILLDYIKKDGIIVLVVYHGHIGGKREKDLVLDYVTNLNQSYYQVLEYGFINQKNNPPFIIAIQKRNQRRK